MKESKSFSLFDHISKTPLLTHEDEVRLSKLVKQGDKKARDKMINANLRLSLNIAKKYSKKGNYDIDDLFQESILGLSRAIDNFDHEKGFRFSTYAYWWILQSVKQFIAQNCGAIELPSNTYSKLFKISEFKKSYKKKFGRSPTDFEVATEFATTPETITALTQSASKAVCIDAPIGGFAGDSDVTFGSIIPSYEKSVEDKIDEYRLTKTIRHALENTLDAREKFIIEQRFGLDGI